MKLSENNCQSCDYNAPYIYNLSDKMEDRLCGACLSLYIKEGKPTSIKSYKVTNIDWDTDGEQLNLPSECLINIEVSSDITEKEVEESISNAITNMSNFCHNGFNYEGPMRFLVWVGGVLDYEGCILSEAKSIRREWISEGYDDCYMETISEEQYRKESQ